MQQSCSMSKNKKAGNAYVIDNRTDAYRFWGIKCRIFADTEVVFVTLTGALPLGLIIAFGSMTRFLPVRWLSRTLVWIIRGTPLMIQLLIIYYFPDWCLEIRFGEAERQAVLWQHLFPLYSIMPAIFLKFTAAVFRVYQRGSRRQGLYWA